MFDFDPAYGLWGLALYSFLAATLLPGGSELALALVVGTDPSRFGLALLIATVGNTAGGMVSWWCGRIMPSWKRVESLPHLDKVRRWGSPSLLLAWTPVVGDALCLAAGWLRLHWWPCLVFMAIGKLARYWVVAQAVV